MSFDFNAFENAPVNFPTKKIPVPQLKNFFPEGEEPEWEIKSLTGIEIAISNQAPIDYRRKKAMIEALTDDNASSIAMKKAFQELLGKCPEDTMPEEYLRWLKIVEFGSIPHCPESICVKLAHAKGAVFRLLANDISVMSGLGADMGE